MYHLFRKLSSRQWLFAEGPSLALSVLIAEFFYKFHSFTLECMAFLATWFVVGSVLNAVSKPLIERHPHVKPEA